MMGMLTRRAIDSREVRGDDRRRTSEAGFVIEGSLLIRPQ
jgi:hypothetical protein